MLPKYKKYWYWSHGHDQIFHKPYVFRLSTYVQLFCAGKSFVMCGSKISMYCSLKSRKASHNVYLPRLQHETTELVVEVLGNNTYIYFSVFAMFCLTCMCQFVAAGDWVELFLYWNLVKFLPYEGYKRKGKTFFGRKLVKPLISTNNVKCPQSIFISLYKSHLMNFACISTKL